MKRGEIYRTAERIPERGDKPGFYLVVSRDFVAGNEDLSTVVCAPIYGEILGLRSEVFVGLDEGVPRDSSVRCDFLTLLFKRKLARFSGQLGGEKLKELDQALRYALGL